MEVLSSFLPFGEDQARGHYEDVYRGDALLQPHRASKMHECTLNSNITLQNLMQSSARWRRGMARHECL